MIFFFLLSKARFCKKKGRLSLTSQSNPTYVGQSARYDFRPRWQQPPLHRRLFIQSAGLFVSHGVVLSVLNITSAKMCFLRGVTADRGEENFARDRKATAMRGKPTGTIASFSSATSNIRCTSRCQISQHTPYRFSSRSKRDAFVSSFYRK